MLYNNWRTNSIWTKLLCKIPILIKWSRFVTWPERLTSRAAMMWLKSLEVLCQRGPQVGSLSKLSLLCKNSKSPRGQFYAIEILLWEKRNIYPCRVRYKLIPRWSWVILCDISEYFKSYWLCFLTKWFSCTLRIRPSVRFSKSYSIKFSRHSDFPTYDTTR